MTILAGCRTLEAKNRLAPGFSLPKPAACFHGGAFFHAIGPGFEFASAAGNN